MLPAHSDGAARRQQPSSPRHRARPPPRRGQSPPYEDERRPLVFWGYFSSRGPEASDNRRARHGPVQGPRTEAHRYLLPSRQFHPPFFSGLGSPKILPAQSDIEGIRTTPWKRSRSSGPTGGIPLVSPILSPPDDAHSRPDRPTREQERGRRAMTPFGPWFSMQTRCRDQMLAGTTNGGRYLRVSILSASGSPTNFSFLPSKITCRPRR